MNPRTTEHAGGATAAEGGGWRTVWMREGLAAPSHLGVSRPIHAVEEPDAEAARRPWFRDYDEIE